MNDQQVQSFMFLDFIGRLHDLIKCVEQLGQPWKGKKY
jgi:hypothetical protein